MALKEEFASWRVLKKLHLRRFRTVGRRCYCFLFNRGTFYYEFICTEYLWKDTQETEICTIEQGPATPGSSSLCSGIIGTCLAWFQETASPIHSLPPPTHYPANVIRRSRIGYNSLGFNPLLPAECARALPESFSWSQPEDTVSLLHHVGKIGSKEFFHRQRYNLRRKFLFLFLSVLFLAHGVQRKGMPQITWPYHNLGSVFNFIHKTTLAIIMNPCCKKEC